VSEIQHFFTKYKYKNDLDLLTTVINVYSLVALRESPTKRQKEVLVYYLKSGYNEQTWATVKLGLGITDEHLRQINYELRKKEKP